MFDVSEKSAIITGAASGIGLELARGLAKAGAHVACVDQNMAGAESTAAAICSAGGRAVAVAADVTDAGAVRAMVDQVTGSFGGVDILVNCAGVNSQAPAEEMDEATWNRVIGVNLTGTFLVDQAVGRQMIQQGRGGSIVNISSICSTQIMKTDYQCAYYASKAAVAQLSRALAVEWTKYDIKVNAIAPGFTATPMFQADRDKNNDSAQLLDSVPMGRFQDPRDLVGAVIFLASGASSYVTGHELYSDGGRSCL